MLKSNTRKAENNILQYIKKYYDSSNYPEAFDTLDVVEMCYNVYEVFKTEKPYMLECENTFIAWCSGLPSILDCCYYYNRSAVADVAMILEETPKETEKYNESDAERLLSHLLYRVIKKYHNKCVKVYEHLQSYANTLVNDKQFDEINEHEYVTSVENAGIGSLNADCILYVVTFRNGSEMCIYG